MILRYAVKKHFTIWYALGTFFFILLQYVALACCLYTTYNQHSTQDAAYERKKKGREKKKRSGNFYVTFSGSYNHKCLLLLPRNGYVLLTSFAHHKCMQKKDNKKQPCTLLCSDLSGLFKEGN